MRRTGPVSGARGGGLGWKECMLSLHTYMCQHTPRLLTHLPHSHLAPTSLTVTPHPPPLQSPLTHLPHTASGDLNQFTYELCPLALVTVVSTDRSVKKTAPPTQLHPLSPAHSAPPTLPHLRMSYLLSTSHSAFALAAVEGVSLLFCLNFFLSCFDSRVLEPAARPQRDRVR